MAFALKGLPPAAFQRWFQASGPELAAAGGRLITVDEDFGYPCRVSLTHAAVGEQVLLIPYQHVAGPSPYQAIGPVFVRRDAAAAAEVVDTIPPYLSRRLLSVRAYDDKEDIVDAEVAPGDRVDGLIRKLLAAPAIEHLHIHFARRGCFACNVVRSA